jgi:hypothetical protein
LRQASAYFRLAAKARRAANWSQAEHYQGIADRLVNENRRDREWAAERKAR